MGDRLVSPPQLSLQRKPITKLNVCISGMAADTERQKGTQTWRNTESRIAGLCPQRPARQLIGDWPDSHSAMRHWGHSQRSELQQGSQQLPWTNCGKPWQNVSENCLWLVGFSGLSQLLQGDQECKHAVRIPTACGKRQAQGHGLSPPTTGVSYASGPASVSLAVIDTLWGESCHSSHFTCGETERSKHKEVEEFERASPIQVMPTQGQKSILV